MKALDTPLLKSVKDDLGVRMVCFPTVFPYLLEFFADIRVIVDLAVENYLKGAVLVGHRLVGDRRKVNDGKTPVAQTDRFVLRDPGAGAIRPPMGHRVAHFGNIRFRDRESTGFKVERADDAAHRFFLGSDERKLIISSKNRDSNRKDASGFFDHFLRGERKCCFKTVQTALAIYRVWLSTRTQNVAMETIKG